MWDLIVSVPDHCLSFYFTVLEKVCEPRHEKTCLQGFRLGKTQTDRLCYRDSPESWHFGFSKYRYYTI